MRPKASPETIRGSGAKRRTSSSRTLFSSFWYPRGSTPAKAGVCRLDRIHREVDVCSEVFAFGKVDEPRQAGDLGHEQYAAGAEVVCADGPSLGRLQFELRS